MKQTHKRFLGILSLVAVTVVTAFAAYLPAPETQATSSATDEVTVRVVGEEAELYVSEKSVDSNNLAKVTFNYGKIQTLHLKVIYNGGQSTERVITLPDVPAGYGVTSSLEIQFNLPTGDYKYNDAAETTGNIGFGSNKYGNYKIYAWGSGNGTGEKSASVEFEYKESGEVVPVPDTGTFTNTEDSVGIDYTLISVGIFFLIAISGFVYIFSKEKKNRERRK